MYLSRNAKSKIFYCYYRKADDNKKTRISCRTTKKKNALEFISNFQDELKKRMPSNTITLGELRKKYLTSIEVTHTKSSYRHSRKCIENFIKYLGEDVLINKITKEQIETFIHTIFKRAKYSASLHLRSLKAVFNKAIDWGYLEKNNFKGLRLRIPTNNPVFINKDELDLIVKKEPNLILKQIYIFAFYKGLRRGEILTLKKDNIDINNRLIKLFNTDTFTTKSGRPHVMPMANTVIDILNNISKNNSDYIFNNNGERFNPPYVTKKFKRAVRSSGLDEKIHFHTLRHSFASCLAEKGVNLYVISKLLNHKNTSTTAIYSHLSISSLTDAVSLLD